MGFENDQIVFHNNAVIQINVFIFCINSKSTTDESKKSATGRRQEQLFLFFNH